MTSLPVGSQETLKFFFRCDDSEFFIMKKSKIALITFLFLIQIGELKLPLFKSTRAKNTLVITEKEGIALNANSYVKEGIKKGKYGNYQEAVHAFNQAILIDEFHSIAYYNRGFAKFNLNDYEGAISDYDKAIDINPHYGIAYFNRGLSRYHLGDFEGAVSDYTQSIVINVDDADGYLNRGLLYFEIGNDKFACKDLRKAASLGNQFSASWLKSDEGHWCLSNSKDVKKVFLF